MQRLLAQKGFTSIALDLRAHGESEGRFCTFGVKEKKDISSLIAYLLEHESVHEPIGIWGQSLGGAVSLQAMATDKRIAFGVIESTFGDFHSIVHDHAKHYLGFNIKPITNYLICRAGRIADFDSSMAAPIEHCKQIDQPILLVHGEQDEKISVAYARKNFNNIKSNYKELLLIPKAKHTNVWELGGDEYKDRIINFVNSVALAYE